VLNRRASNSVIEKISCRLDKKTLGNYFQENQTPDEQKPSVELWFRVSRCLFSNSSISLRMVGPLVSHLQSKDDREHYLKMFLDSKLPTLGDYTLERFVQTFLKYEILERSKENEYQSPFEMLFVTAALDVVSHFAPSIFSLFFFFRIGSAFLSTSLWPIRSAFRRIQSLDWRRG
jgi:hypothetical protein